MKQNQRAVVAGIAAALINGGRIRNIYSYELSKYIFLSGSVDKRHINVYDYSRSCHVSGNSSDGKQYGLYDYGNSCHVNISINGNAGKGYDYGSGYHFSFTVTGNSLSLYDYETGHYYSYSY